MSGPSPRRRRDARGALGPGPQHGGGSDVLDRQPPAGGGPGTDRAPEPRGQVSVGFGLVTYDVAKSRTDSDRELQLWLAGVLADTVGVLLALLWTAGFLPSFLEPQAVTVLLQFREGLKQSGRRLVVPAGMVR